MVPKQRLHSPTGCHSRELLIGKHWNAGLHLLFPHGFLKYVVDSLVHWLSGMQCHWSISAGPPQHAAVHLENILHAATVRLKAELLVPCVLHRLCEILPVLQ